MTGRAGEGIAGRMWTQKRPEKAKQASELEASQCGCSLVSQGAARRGERNRASLRASSSPLPSR